MTNAILVKDIAKCTQHIYSFYVIISNDNTTDSAFNPFDKIHTSEVNYTVKQKYTISVGSIHFCTNTILVCGYSNIF